MPFYINGLYREDSGGSKQYYLYNGHGGVVQLGNDTGAVTKTYNYHEFFNKLTNKVIKNVSKRIVYITGSHSFG